MLGKYCLPLALVGVVFAGCGDDTTNGDEGDGAVVLLDSGTHDAGKVDGSADAGARLTLQSGTYNTSHVVRLSDGCGLTLEDGSFTELALVNTGTLISLGTHYTSTTSTQWTPDGYGLGSGPYLTATTATLAVAAHVTLDTGCEFDVTRTTQVTATGNNAVSIDYTDNETNQNATCKASKGEATATCTSHYTFDLSM